MKVWRFLRTCQHPKPMELDCRGQALVEMAIVFMLMMTIVVASVDFGVYLFRYVQAANCVREAARRAVVRADNAANPPYCVDRQLPKPTITSYDGNRCPPPTSSFFDYKIAKPGTPVTAFIDLPYDWLALDAFIPGLSSIRIKTCVTMRMEGQVVGG